MKEKTLLTREEVLLISFMGVIGNIVYIHTWIDDEADRSAWLAGMIGILAIIPFALIILYLGKFMPKGTLLNIIEDGIGKIPASVVCLAYFFINILIGATHLNMFTAMINTFFLPLTPSWFVMAFLVLIGFLLCRGKLTSIGRFIEVLAVLGVLNYFLTFLFSFSKDFHIEYIYPIFDTSLYGFLKGCLFISGSASETLLILIIFVRSIPNPEKHFRWAVNGIMAASVIFPLAILIIMAIMSPELAKRIAYGGVNAARLIAVGKYIQGLEVFILIAYQMIAIGKLTISLYCAWISIKDLFNNKMPGTLLFMTSAIMFASSVWINSYNIAYSMAVFAASYIILPFSMFVIILTAICVKLRNNKLKRFSK